MFAFIIGLWVGGIFGFGICAICTIARTDDKPKNQRSTEAGERNAGSK